MIFNNFFKSFLKFSKFKLILIFLNLYNLLNSFTYSYSSFLSLEQVVKVYIFL